MVVAASCRRRAVCSIATLFDRRACVVTLDELAHDRRCRRCSPPARMPRRDGPTVESGKADTAALSRAPGPPRAASAQRSIGAGAAGAVAARAAPFSAIRRSISATDSRMRSSSSAHRVSICSDRHLRFAPAKLELRDRLGHARFDPLHDLVDARVDLGRVTLHLRRRRSTTRLSVGRRPSACSIRSIVARLSSSTRSDSSVGQRCQPRLDGRELLGEHGLAPLSARCLHSATSDIDAREARSELAELQSGSSSTNRVVGRRPALRTRPEPRIESTAIARALPPIDLDTAIQALEPSLELRQPGCERSVVQGRIVVVIGVDLTRPHRRRSALGKLRR